MTEKHKGATGPGIWSLAETRRDGREGRERGGLLCALCRGLLAVICTSLVLDLTVLQDFVARFGGNGGQGSVGFFLFFLCCSRRVAVWQTSEKGPLSTRKVSCATPVTFNWQKEEERGGGGGGSPAPHTPYIVLAEQIG